MRYKADRHLIYTLHWYILAISFHDVMNSTRLLGSQQQSLAERSSRSVFCHKSSQPTKSVSKKLEVWTRNISEGAFLSPSPAKQWRRCPRFWATSMRTVRRGLEFKAACSVAFLEAIQRSELVLPLQCSYLHPAVISSGRKGELGLTAIFPRQALQPWNRGWGEVRRVAWPVLKRQTALPFCYAGSTPLFIHRTGQLLICLQHSDITKERLFLPQAVLGRIHHVFP